MHHERSSAILCRPVQACAAWPPLALCKLLCWLRGHASSPRDTSSQTTAEAHTAQAYVQAELTAVAKPGPAVPPCHDTSS